MGPKVKNLEVREKRWGSKALGPYYQYLSALLLMEHGLVSFKVVGYK